jgi:hypothetical protein
MAEQVFAAALRERFLRERQYIQRFVTFLEGTASVSESHVRQVLYPLEHRGIELDLEERIVRRWDQPYTVDELESLLTKLRDAAPALEAAIAEAQQQAERYEQPDRLRHTDARSTEGEWIEHAADRFRSEGLEQEVVDAVRLAIAEGQAEAVREQGDDADTLDAAGQDFVVRGALYITSRREVAELTEAKRQIAELEMVHRLIRPDSELGLFRQGFILLMTMFDAAVFDLVRLALRVNFFGLIAGFSRQGRFSLEDLANSGSFELFRDLQIEEQLKQRYLKDLLFILEQLGVELSDAAAGDRPVHLVELVLRRNVHVHNRGVIDERYLERDVNGTPRFNLFNLQIGSTATIDRAYWERADRLCGNAVTKLADWVQGQEG